MLKKAAKANTVTFRFDPKALSYLTESRSDLPPPCGEGLRVGVALPSTY